MIKDYKKDHIIRSFLNSLYIEKGLSKNTVSSYENDISSFLSWLNKKQKIINMSPVRILMNLFQICLILV